MRGARGCSVEWLDPRAFTCYFNIQDETHMGRGTHGGVSRDQQRLGSPKRWSVEGRSGAARALSFWGGTVASGCDGAQPQDV